MAWESDYERVSIASQKEAHSSFSSGQMDGHRPLATACERDNMHLCLAVALYQAHKVELYRRCEGVKRPRPFIEVSR